jgi:hypothetical protein
MSAPKLSDYVKEETKTVSTTAVSATSASAANASTANNIASDVDFNEAQGAVVKRDFDVESSEVKDRWSRYIGAMGIDAVRRQASSTVFISGMSALGAEIAKNVVLSGVKQMTIHDTTPAQVSLLRHRLLCVDLIVV